MGHSLLARKTLDRLLDEARGETRLRRVLGPVPLTSLGVGAVIAGPAIDLDPTRGGLMATGSLLNLPALLVSALVTAVLVVAIRESASLNTALVVVKVVAVTFVIVVGAFYVDPRNWRPFAPYGWTGLTVFGHTVAGGVDAGGRPQGMLAGAALAFFAYIGFDSVSTHAEEARAPQRDVPIGIIVSLVLCTLLYMGTLLAFAVVCAAVLVMRRTHPEVERPFRAPLVPLVPVLGILSCLMLMSSLPSENWIRLLVWLALGLVIYFAYGRRHSILRE